jgi:long-chain acyl-CoA synthetase
MASEALGGTLVHQLNTQAERREAEPALWTRRDGKWVDLSWRAYANRVRAFALGLESCGVRPGARVGLWSSNREEWLVGALASMALGATAVGLNPGAAPEQQLATLAQARARVAVVEGEHELSALHAARSRLPELGWMVVMDPPARIPAEVRSFAELVDRGATVDDAPYYASLAAARPGDVAAIVYTSGARRPRRGVMLTHRNLCRAAASLCATAGLEADDVLLSHVSLAHVGEQVCSLAAPLVAGLQVCFSERSSTLLRDLREVRPSVFFAVPEVWQTVKHQAEALLARLPAPTRRVLRWAREVALRANQAQLEGRPVSVSLQLEAQAARRVVLPTLTKALGLDRCRHSATSVEALPREVLDFFVSLDVVVREVYGHSEATGPVAMNAVDATRLGTLGRPLRGVEVRIAGDGEILVRGESLFAGYVDDALATSASLREGWLHTGDLGSLDVDGFLRLQGAKAVAPDVSQ